MTLKKEPYPPSPPNKIARSINHKWLLRLHTYIDKNLDKPLLNNERLADAMEVSKRQLFRKVKSLTNISPQRYLSQYRIKKAMKFLQKGKYRTVKKTALAVGFRNPSYFIRQFEKMYGKKPLQVLQESGWR